MTYKIISRALDRLQSENRQIELIIHVLRLAIKSCNSYLLLDFERYFQITFSFVFPG